jgi:hypothetical protein
MAFAKNAKILRETAKISREPVKNYVRTAGIAGSAGWPGSTSDEHIISPPEHPT